MMKLLKSLTTVAVLAMVSGSTAFASEWIACAGENQYCSVPGTKMVRYGAGDRWSMKMATRQIHCGNDVFGDPAPGVTKACYYQNTSAPYEQGYDTRRPHPGRDDERHGGWVQCAGEGGFCNFNGNREVRYGTGDRWNYKTARNGIGCGNNVFGDPAPGAHKACYYRSSSSGHDDYYRPAPDRHDGGQHVRWRRCAGEGGYCNFNGYRDVRYGNGDRWNYKSATNGIGCSNSVFGDPAPGSSKECFIKID